MNSNISFYIPCISAAMTAGDVINAFRDMGIVSRVDFTPIGKQQWLFEEKVDKFVKSAFVHFSTIFEKGARINIWIRGGETYKFYPFMDTNEYWLIKPTNRVIKDTMMNSAQIVEKCRFLEIKVREQEAKLEEQSAKLEEQAAKLEEQAAKLEEQAAKLEQMATIENNLERVQFVVNQLIGGLFCQKSQERIIYTHQNILFDHSLCEYGMKLQDTHRWTHFPTTRQGDECERRIEALEKKFQEERK